MPHLRPVPEYLVENVNGTIHIVDRRDFYGEHEKALCGTSSTQFNRDVGRDLKDVSEDDPSERLCKRCHNSYFD